MDKVVIDPEMKDLIVMRYLLAYIGFVFLISTIGLFLGWKMFSQFMLGTIVIAVIVAGWRASK